MISKNIITEELLALKSQARSDGDEMVVPITAVEYSLGYLAAMEEEMLQYIKLLIDNTNDKQIKSALLQLLKKRTE